MGLKSRLFSGDRALQNCLDHDAAHVVPGAAGPHVRRIQSALVRLRFLLPAAARREAGRYGNATAAAVLTYKRHFGIVNRRYQTQADNIVGRMTLASLDHSIWVLDGAGRGPRWPAARVHPASPAVVAGGAPAFKLTAGGEVRVAAADAGAAAGAFSPPLSTLAPEMQAVVRRSNAAKVPGKLLLYPYIAEHEGPLPGDELSRRFAARPNETAILQALFDRMRPFDVWKLIDVIESVYQGSGAQGIFCSVRDHGSALAHMVRWTDAHAPPLYPGVPQVQQAPGVLGGPYQLRDARFCRDGFNVHGERDSFREMVTQGPGLHICITNAKGRAMTTGKYPYCDFHIDEVQQGQVCLGGTCVPLVNGQTIEHLWTVGPWLIGLK